MAATLVTRVDTQLSPGNDSHVGINGDNNHRPSKRKRKVAESPSSDKTNVQRQKITRACDYCKEKKTRCTGTLPCVRCTRLSLPCEYNAAYSRGLPPEPVPAHPSSLAKYAPATPRSPVSQRSARASPRRNHVTRSRQQLSNSTLDESLRNSPDPVVTDFEGNYLGPASGVSFINRVWRRLHQDQSSAIPDELQNESVSKNTSVFKFGDKPYSIFKFGEKSNSSYQEAGFALPPFDKALELVGVYFDFSIVTYRFLHRGSVEDWLRNVYESNISSSNLPTGNMVARTAMILMIFAVGTLYKEQEPGNPVDYPNESERWYAASRYMSSIEPGPPRLETVQVRLSQCLYLLSSSRANECWYTFGTALQLVTAMGLHRRWPAKISKNGNAYLDQELRKRVFWSTYTLDKYLSAMFGRPRLLHDEDIDQDLPDEINDDDMLRKDPERRMAPADCMMTASILHYRLGRILGEISRQLYTINLQSRDPPLETAIRLTSELERWKETAPPLFNSVRPTSLIPPLCRQSQVLQLAYSHAMIHVTRSFLLNDFTDLSRRPPVPDPMVTSHVRKCIDAAEDVMRLVDSLAKQGVLIQSFWFTHYVCFCAIIVVYIHTIQQHRVSSSLEHSPQSIEDAGYLCSLFNLAETCQQHLAEATRKNCPSRRYGIILEELRLEVHRQMGSSVQPSPIPITNTLENFRGIFPRNQESAMVQGHMNPTNVDQTYSPDPNTIHYPPISAGLQSSSMAAGGPFGPCEDFGMLDNLEGSIWWTQLDSWAFSSLPNDPSTMTL